MTDIPRKHSPAWFAGVMLGTLKRAELAYDRISRRHADLVEKGVDTSAFAPPSAQSPDKTLAIAEGLMNQAAKNFGAYLLDHMKDFNMDDIVPLNATGTAVDESDWTQVAPITDTSWVSGKKETS